MGEVDPLSVADNEVLVQVRRTLVYENKGQTQEIEQRGLLQMHSAADKVPGQLSALDVKDAEPLLTHTRLESSLLQLSPDCPGWL